MLNKENFQLRKEKIQKEQVLNLAQCPKGLEFSTTWFPYTSGQVGNYYVQSISICSNGGYYAAAIDSIVELIKFCVGEDNFDIVSGGESRDWDFSNPVAVALKKPHTKLYKDGKMIGADPKGKRVLHVADLNNEGSSPRDLWVPAIKKAGGSITDIVFYVDRLEDGVEEMQKLGLKSHAVIELNNDAWHILLKNNYITPEIYTSLLERWQDKKAWAHKALMAYPEILSNVTDDKAFKILKAYPEISEQLVQALEAIKCKHE